MKESLILRFRFWVQPATYFYYYVKSITYMLCLLIIKSQINDPKGVE